MVARDAKESPKTIPSGTQGGRPLHFLRLLSCYPLLEYGTTQLYEYMHMVELYMLDVARYGAKRARHTRDELVTRRA